MEGAVSVILNLFQDLTIDRQMLNQRSTPEGAKVKRVQHDEMIEEEGKNPRHPRRP